VLHDRLVLGLELPEPPSYERLGRCGIGAVTVRITQHFDVRDRITGEAGVMLDLTSTDYQRAVLLAVEESAQVAEAMRTAAAAAAAMIVGSSYVPVLRPARSIWCATRLRRRPQRHAQRAEPGQGRQRTRAVAVGPPVSGRRLVARGSTAGGDRNAALADVSGP
jgi:hypothetical protein